MRRGASRERRRAAFSFDPERECALGHVSVDRQHAPHDLVGARSKRRERHAEERGIGAVDAAVAAVDLSVMVVEDTDGAIRRLETLAEVELHLFRRTLELALDGRLRTL